MDRREARKELAKDNLQGEIAKAIKTTMIGALASVEERFGYLWGIGKKTPLTSDEQAFLDDYSVVRKEILDKGNGQIKRIKSLVDMFDVEFVGTTLNLALPVRRKENDENSRI